MVALATVLDDLAAESADLDALVAALGADEWRRPTPAAGWTVAHQIGHLAWTDDVATTAATDPAAFGSAVQAAVQHGPSAVDDAAAQRAALPPSDLLAGWRSERASLISALNAVPDGVRIPWFGPPMNPASMATARLMETWAHGQDVADALGAVREPTGRLRHVAHLGVRTRDFAYALNDRTPPASPFRVELSGPSREAWTWGPDGAADTVTGSALDFCLLVTQRRHRDDCDLVATGRADEWLGFAQAFAGAPGPGRVATSRV